MRNAVCLFAILSVFSSTSIAQNISFVKDLNQGAQSNGAVSFVEMNGSLYFTTANGSFWRTDGDSTSTVMIKKFSNNFIYSLTVWNNKIYFVAHDSLGFELWSSDGTAQGTQIVKDINPGNSDGISDRRKLSVFNNKLFFVADDGVHGSEL